MAKIKTFYVTVLHDRYWWRVAGKLVVSRLLDPSRWKWASFAYPAPVEHTSKPKGGTNNIRISQAWWDYVRAINSPAAWKALRRNGGGWINFAANKNWKPNEIVPDNPKPLPVVEGITSILCRHVGLERKNGSVRLQCFGARQAPPDPKKINPRTRPELFVQFRSIDILGRVGNAPDGVLCYFPLMAIKPDQAWIGDKKVKVG